MTIKKLIRVTEVDSKGEEKVTYEGEDKRFYNQNYQSPSPFGIPIADLLKIGLTIFAIVTFLIKDNIRIANLEAGQAKLTSISDSMQQYMEAADGFNSSIYGTQFKGGRPLDDGYKNHSYIATDKGGING